MFLQTVGEAIAARAAEEEGNAMKALENRTLDSKREMDIMSALDELQSLNRRQVHVDTGAAIAALQRSIGDSDGEVRSFASILPCNWSVSDASLLPCNRYRSELIL